MIRSLEITDLFGMPGNTKRVTFQPDLTILVGKNGSGKTTILNMLHVLLTSSYKDLFRYGFESIDIEADEGSLRIRKLSAGLHVERYDSATSEQPLFEETLSEANSWQFSKHNNDDFCLGIEPLYFPIYRRLETDFDELLDDLQWGDFFNPLVHGVDVRQRDAQLGFRRPRGRRTAVFARTVVGLSSADIERIVWTECDKVERFERERLNKLIRDFVASLVTEPIQDPKVPQRGREELCKELYESLQRTGLTACLGADPENEVLRYVDMVIESQARIRRQPASKERDSDEMIADISAVMNILSHGYVTRFLEMYREAHFEIEEHRAPFVELLELLGRFMDKPLSLEKHRLVFSEDGKLGFDRLSAGEKQLVTLFVYTKLVARPGDLVLIDEPELSLHIEWQRDLLSSLLHSSKDVHYLVATHSPMIVSRYRDHVVSIGVAGDGEAE